MSRSRLWGLVGLALTLAILLGAIWRARQRRFREGKAGEAGREEEARRFSALLARESEADRKTWAKELDAQRHEDLFLTLWDRLNRASQPISVVAEFGFDDVQIGAAGGVQELSHGIRRVRFDPARSGDQSTHVSQGEWREKLATWAADGWQLGRSTWREILFSPARAQTPAQSVIAASAQLTNARTGERAVLRGDLEITWKSERNETEQPSVKSIFTRHLEWLVRKGPPAFIEFFNVPVPPSPGSMLADPLLVHDLDGDGRSEMMMVGANALLRNKGGAFSTEVLARVPPELVSAALVTDFTGDGKADLLVAGSGGLTLYQNDGRGHFPEAGRRVWSAPEKLKHPQVITAGDIDGDHDLDLWLAQYKLPYQGGQFPTPYFDANDGFPSFLLRNDGGAIFSDVTEASGLGARRNRRTYSASLVDLDASGSLDLVNISDFAGVDLFLNDGHGQFRETTNQLGDARYLFGMAHTLGDVNQDSLIDLFAIGMDSPTAHRLDALGLKRAEFPHHEAKRKLMTYGNRLFFGSPQGLQLASVAEQVAHAGWAWGVSLADVDNDGDLDIAIANGHETRPSVQDYERQFWLHDIYVGSSGNDLVSNAYFKSAAGRRTADQASYGGWQDNVLFLNDGDNGFVDVAFLVGFLVPEDSQNIVSDDIDGDGKLDLVVTAFSPWPGRQPTLRAFRNNIPDAGNWIGFRFDSITRAWPGARIVVATPERTQSRWLVTGDSYRSQHAPAAHFGLGRIETVIKAEVLWPDGSRLDLSNSRINTWNVVDPTGATVPSR